MRHFVFRILSGLLGIAFVWVLIFVDQPRRSLRMTAGIAGVTALFLVHAVFGDRPRESWAGRLIGLRPLSADESQSANDGSTAD